ncbi:MAG: hypothetical protein PHH83_02245 [Patescibacteria group bacterium]|nr:hypothetical protein [Patescibacteria group bacterium]
MLVYYYGEPWETDDISPRIAHELRESCPRKKISLTRCRDDFKKTVEIQELEFQNEH